VSQCAKYLLPLKWIEQEEFENLREFQKQQSTKQLTANLADDVHELTMKCE
jgi:hypothetical protein